MHVHRFAQAPRHRTFATLTDTPMQNSSVRHIRLVPLTLLGKQWYLKILDIRNEEGVRKWMYTDHEISVDEHLGWVERLKTDDTQIAFAVLGEDGNPLGLVSVNAINRKHARADWAYYLTDGARGGLGAALEYSFINFVFDDLDIVKLNCEVIEGNDAVVKMHKKFLFQEEGFRQSNIHKGNERLGVHFLGLTKDEWFSGRCDVYERYKSTLQKFSLQIEWEKFSNFDAEEAIGLLQMSRQFWEKSDKEILGAK